MANMKKPAPKKPTVSRAPSQGVRTPMPKIQGTAPSPRRLLASATTNTTKKTAPKPKAKKKSPLETKRIGGVFAIPVKPKKTIY
jgi:hypothetical protein